MPRDGRLTAVGWAFGFGIPLVYLAAWAAFARVLYQRYRIHEVEKAACPNRRTMRHHELDCAACLITNKFWWQEKGRSATAAVYTDTGCLALAFLHAFPWPLTAPAYIMVRTASDHPALAPSEVKAREKAQADRIKELRTQRQVVARARQLIRLTHHPHSKETDPVTNPNRRHVFVVADRSGSMQSCRQATQEGIDEFFAGQKQIPGHTTASLFQFDTEHDTVFEHVDVADAPRYELVPRGATALLDAIGFAFTREGEWLAAMDEADRPGEVVAVIATDGEDNSSQEWIGGNDDPVRRIRELVTQQQDVYGWHVLFVGANVDAIKTAAAFNISASQSMTYNTTATGTASTWTGVTNLTARAAAGGGYAFTPSERAAAVDADGDAQ